MRFFSDLRTRHRQPEIMDQPNLDESEHRRALQGLRRINWWTGSAGILWPALKELAGRSPRPLRVLDVATGGGDVPVRLWQRSRRAGLPLEIAGCDLSPTALAHAHETARQAGAAVNFFPCDLLNQPLPEGYDVVTCSLFLHHLDEPQAQEFLRRAAEATGQALLVSDLRRCRLGLLAATVGTWLLTSSPVVRVDGPLSVQGAFTVPEVRTLAERAGLHKVQVVNKWPFRFLLSWDRHSKT